MRFSACIERNTFFPNKLSLQQHLEDGASTEDTEADGEEFLPDSDDDYALREGNNPTTRVSQREVQKLISEPNDFLSKM